jgi:hypothetical protein
VSKKKQTPRSSCIMEFMCCLKKVTLEQSSVGKEQKLKEFKPQVHKMGIV